MTGKVLFVLFGCFIVAFCQTSEADVDETMEAVEKLIEQAFTWVSPTDSSSYLDGYDENSECTDDGLYDFIIVGAGSAGSLLANRLSEIYEWKIQIIEAGYKENNISNIPGVANLLRTTDWNWGYDTTPQKYFEGFINSSLVFPIGKALGGSSVINYMMYVRGNKEDFQKWEAMGNPGWSYEDVLPYFKKSEYATFPNADPKYHGKNGTMNVEYVRYFDKSAQAFLDGQKELGRKTLDYNGEDQLGFSILQANEINGTRETGAGAFLYPIKDRPNLHISTETLVTKILINKDKKAFGVKYLRNGHCYCSRARKEVIVSAGAMNTPQLLMLSGVGPKRHLEEFGIPVLKDLAVGENLWNHLCYSSLQYSINFTYPNSSLRSEVTAYLEDGREYYTTAAGIQALGFVTMANNTWPDLEYVYDLKLPSSLPYEFYKNTYRYTKEAYEHILQPQANYTSFVPFVVLLHSKSRGTVRLKSRLPTDFPLIDPNYFDDPNDISTLLAGVRDMQKLANTAAMQAMGAQLINVSLPICESYESGSDDFWMCMIRNLADTIHHYGGTCKMGPRSDDKAVVDARLRVHGIWNLRVVDCSVMPTTSSGHTNAVANMIAEKAAYIIKEDHQYYHHPRFT